MNDLKAFTPRRLKIALLALPLLVTGLYLLFAADRYVSESTVSLQQASNDPGAAIPGAALLLAGLTPPSREDTLVLRQYVQSLGLLLELDRKLGIRRHYENATRDPLFKLHSGSSQEDFLAYWRSRVEVNMDEISATLTLRVQGFDAAFAKKLNDAILEASERFVNENSHKIAREKLAFADGELNRAGQRLQQAKADLLGFQTQNRLLDPTVQAQASGALVAEMQSSITRAEAELRSLRTFLSDDAYQVKALRAQIDALKAQLQLERGRATGAAADGGRQGEQLNALAADYQGLQMKAEFALDAYKLALAAVENARIDATRKIKSLIVIEAPTLPETAEYPRRLYNLATLAIACLLLYGVVRLVIATIREHQD